MESGLSVYEEIRKQSVDLKNKEIEPTIVVLGSYCYYLLKDYFVREVFPDGYDRYKELINVEISGFKLELFIHRDTLIGGVFNEKSLNVKVYG